MVAWAWRLAVRLELGGAQGPLDSADKFEEYILTQVNGGAPGICFDEWIGFDAESQKLRGAPEKEKYPGNPKNRMLAEACRRIKEEHPDVFIGACTHMHSDALIEALQKGWVDLAIVESYPYVAGEPAWTPGLAMWRLGNAKMTGVMKKTIPAFWISPEDETFTAEWLEGWIKRFRKEFPQMPGVAPFFPGGHDHIEGRTQHLVRGCDRLIQKYYIDPAPKVRITKPSDGALVAESTPVEIRAEASAPIAKWRLYLGTALVAEREGDGVGAVTFEPRTLPPGHHVLTVHGITDVWLRGVEQIAIVVEAQ